MSNYLPLARRYRPSKFADLVGQEVLTKTLTHAITNNKIAQSYLLSGIRGIGKTTSARIIAKTINCTAPVTEESWIRACEECANCTGFRKGSHPDIVEIDAASRTGVDDIRLVIESSEYKPLMGKYKVFIIDEVHMLSKNAFNALLKTLEEPPLGVVFIFATTEVNKIPLTIISRCQRFDLRRLTTDELTALLSSISKEEGINAEEEALKHIAAKADGSARDALSMLDQAAALSASGITLEQVSKMTQTTNLDMVVDFVASLLQRKAHEALQMLEQVYLTSSDLTGFVEAAIDVIGYLSKVKAIKEYRLADYAGHHDKILEMIKDIDLGSLTVLWQIFTKGASELKASHNQLLSAEMLAIKAVYASGLPSPHEVVDMALKGDLPRRDGAQE